MKREEAKAKFVRGAEEMFEEMWEWGEENPQASFDEMAGKLAGLRRELMGEMLGELVLQHGDGRYEEEVCPSEDEVERKAHAHGDPCRRASKGEANASPLSGLWAGDFSPWTADYS